ncbi:biotin synthase auxiliary protein BsaP [Tomitella biformata]|uniref:biotin synthase auxiliary protein BsaP n=1 Tax=Tomitella biformata TaxID=630403 RepID=UPI000462F15F|nr:hypothetical protein [Tomitella biformata]
MRLSDAGGPLDEELLEFNLYTGLPLADADGSAMPTAAQLGLEPPRYCGVCGRRMVVQVEPNSWWARCSRHGVVDAVDLERR